MKLIELLVQKLGGWPIDKKHHAFIAQDDDGDLWAYPSIPHLDEKRGDWTISSGDGCYLFNLNPADDNKEAIITREQYEAALTASKPEWDGVGLPPVGYRVEANYGGEWLEVTVAYTDRPEAHGDAVAWKEALVFDCKTTRPFWADEFRPIRSEADKKRYEALFAIAELCRNSASNGHLAELIYAAIKSRKIVID